MLLDALRRQDHRCAILWIPVSLFRLRRAFPDMAPFRVGVLALGENQCMADRVGQILGNYQLLRVLGRGAFAEVYLAEHQYLEIPAAIKVLHQYLSTGAWIAAAGGVQ